MAFYQQKNKDQNVLYNYSLVQKGQYNIYENITGRIKQHFYELRRGHHHSTYLQNSFKISSMRRIVSLYNNKVKLYNSIEQ